MPELPDITVYVEALERHVQGHALQRVLVPSPSLLRTFDPRPSEAEGRKVVDVRSLGKRLVLSFEGDLHFVMHLMVAGRLRWRPHAEKPPPRSAMAVLDFDHGRLLFTEAGSRHRASLHVVHGTRALEAFLPEGVDPLADGPKSFVAALRRENRTLKRALTDPRIVAGIGNAYSDEILHAARLSPVQLTSRTTDEELVRLHEAVGSVLTQWTQRLRDKVGDGFPDKVTAFHAQMAVHGKYQRPCPVCATPVQRIRRAQNEVNYCPTCQTGGRLLADRALSRLLAKDWPKTWEEMEQRLERSRRLPD